MVFLAQTDTTVGFLGASSKVLADLKSRPQGKSFLQVCPDFKALKVQVRPPKTFAKRIRRSTKTTFAFGLKAIRVVKDDKHCRFLRRAFECNGGAVYSTSANQSGQTYDAHFAQSHADILVHQGAFGVARPSRLLRLHKQKIKRLR